MTLLLDEVIGHIGLDDADRARLVELHAVLAPHFAAIASDFYESVHASSTAELLADPALAERHRTHLVDWMASGLLGPYDRAFRAKRSRIGRRHVEVGLAQHFMITAMTIIRRAYGAHIAAAYPPDQALAVRGSADKLLDLELALMLHDYRVDSRALQTMCSGLAHEIRNPLNSAKLQLELLERRLQRGGVAGGLVAPVEHVHDELDRVTGLLDEFLAFARPPAVDAHATDIIAIARYVIERERPLAERRGAELALAGDTSPILAEVDYTKLEQIVDHLVRNAIEAVPPGGHVAVACALADDHVRVRVSDDGTGIPARVLPHIYEPFFSTKDGGTGMGMSIVQSLVTLHRGTIDVTTSPSGTTFEIHLPRTWR